MLRGLHPFRRGRRALRQAPREASRPRVGALPLSPLPSLSLLSLPSLLSLSLSLSPFSSLSCLFKKQVIQNEELKSALCLTSKVLCGGSASALLRSWTAPRSTPCSCTSTSWRLRLKSLPPRFTRFTSLTSLSLPDSPSLLLRGRRGEGSVHALLSLTSLPVAGPRPAGGEGRLEGGEAGDPSEGKHDARHLQPGQHGRNQAPGAVLDVKLSRRRCEVSQSVLGHSIEAELRSSAQVADCVKGFANYAQSLPTTPPVRKVPRESPQERRIDLK